MLFRSIDEIMELQNEIVNNLSNVQTFANDSREFILNEVFNDKTGKAIGVFSGNRLVAFRTMTFPGNSDWNLGRELNLPENELDRVAHLEATVVHSEYSGNRLQAKMMKHTLRIIDEMGLFHICSTVSPFNYPSLKNVMDAGLTIRALRQREGPYEGKWRFLLSRDTRQDLEQKFESCVEIENEKLVEQQEILKKNFVGFLLTRNNYSSNLFKIHYGLPF